jgi:hypothetical protein
MLAQQRDQSSVAGPHLPERLEAEPLMKLHGRRIGRLYVHFTAQHEAAVLMAPPHQPLIHLRRDICPSCVEIDCDLIDVHERFSESLPKSAKFLAVIVIRVRHCKQIAANTCSAIRDPRHTRQRNESIQLALIQLRHVRRCFRVNPQDLDIIINADRANEHRHIGLTLRVSRARVSERRLHAFVS